MGDVVCVGGAFFQVYCHSNHEPAATARSNSSVGKLLIWHLVTIPFHKYVEQISDKVSRTYLNLSKPPKP